MIPASLFFFVSLFPVVSIGRLADPGLLNALRFVNLPRYADVPIAKECPAFARNVNKHGRSRGIYASTRKFLIEYISVRHLSLLSEGQSSSSLATAHVRRGRVRFRGCAWPHDGNPGRNRGRSIPRG